MTTTIRTDSKTSTEYMEVTQKGRPLLLDPFVNKGTAFDQRERDELSLNGLLPPRIFSIDEQLNRVYTHFQSKTTDLDRYIYLAGLHDRNQTLFYRLVHEHIDEMMPIIYTPVVGQACQRFSHIYRRARGLYVSYENRGGIARILRNYHCQSPAVMVVTDGERILGLGDQGVGGMGIPIGKLCLYTLCAGISPYETLPITLDVGTDNEDRLNDPLYLGLRHKRIRGEKYQEFIDEFVAAVQTEFPSTLLQWEDLLKANAIRQLKRFRDRICSFNDDIQGTAAVVLAGIYGALRISKQPLRESRIVIAGAGAAAQGIAGLFTSALRDEGLSLEQARKHVWTVDSRGLVTNARQGLEEFKADFARDVSEVAEYDCADRSRITLEETVRNVKPSILIGTSAAPGTFTENIVKLMSDANERPIILPLSNPTSKSECTAEEAIRWSSGRGIVATGSPFEPVKLGDRRFRIGQCNNAYLFPGVGLGIIAGKCKRVSDGMFLDAAKALAGEVSSASQEAGAVFPDLKDIRECSQAVACAVIRRAIAENHSDLASDDDLGKRVRECMWFPEYRPIRYKG